VVRLVYHTDADGLEDQGNFPAAENIHRRRVMNLRNLTQTYLGWCPGIKSAARFIPDRFID